MRKTLVNTVEAPVGLIAWLKEGTELVLAIKMYEAKYETPKPTYWYAFDGHAVCPPRTAVCIPV